MSWNIEVNEKAIYRETKTSEQHFQFQVPISREAAKDTQYVEQEVDVKDGDKLMCKLELNLTFEPHRIEIGMSAKEAISEMNVVVSAVLLGRNSFPTNRRDVAKYLQFKETGRSDEMKIRFNLNRDWEEFAQRQSEHDDHLVIRFKMSVVYQNPALPRETVLMEDFTKKTGEERNAALQTLLTSPTFQNVKLIASDGVIVHANKTLIGFRCPNFEAMVLRSNVQAETGVFQVENVKGKVLKILVEYWYTGRLAESWCAPEVIGDLAVAAKKYGVTPLVELLDGAMGDESIVTSDPLLLEITGNAGYNNAEKLIIKNLVKRTSSAMTRDSFYEELGVDIQFVKKSAAELVNDPMKLRALLLAMDNGWGEGNSTAENLNFVAELGLAKQVKQILTCLNRKLKRMETGQELLAAIGLSGANLVEIVVPAKKEPKPAIDDSEDSFFSDSD